MTNNINQHNETCIDNPEVVVSDEPIVRVNQEHMETLKEHARQNPRSRIQLCAHPDVNNSSN